MTRPSQLLGAGSLLALTTMAASPAFASGTQAGIVITNTVQVDYQVGGVAQNQISASDTFTVDRKVSLTVAEVNTTTTQVSPGQPSAVTAFTITNTSNATLDFALSVAQQSGGAGAHSNTDTFDAGNVRIYVDTNTSGGFDAGDAQVTYLDELATDTSRTVFVVADIPLGRVTNDVAVVTLTATGHEGGGTGSQGAALVQTNSANTSGMDTVFADGAGATDSARDAAYSAKEDYTVLAAALSVLKTSRVVSDPLNGTANPKLIPGALIEYCIKVANAAGGAAATSVMIADVLPTTTTYAPAFGNLMNGTVTAGACNADGTAGGNFAAGTVTGTLPSIAAGDTRTFVFRVTVN